MKKLPLDQQVDFLRTLVEGNVRAIAEHEDRVRIECKVLASRVVLRVHVAPTDIGLVLGPEGATVNAIRRITWTACKKTIYRCDIDVVTSLG